MKYLAPLFAAALMCFTGSARAQLSAGNDLAVENPFAARIARERFQSCFPETTDQQRDALARIALWRYDWDRELHAGCPPQNPQCNPAVTWRRLQRTIHLSVPEAAPSRVESQAEDAEDQSCTSPRSISNFSTRVESRRLTYGFHVRQRSRVCPPWGGSLTVAEVEMDIEAGYVLEADFTLTPFSREMNKRGNVLGIFNGSSGLALIASALTGMPVVLPVVSDIVINHQIAQARFDNFLAIGPNLVGPLASGPLARLAATGVTALDFSDRGNQSGFRQFGDSVVVEFSADAYVDAEAEAPGVDITRRFEVDFLRSLSRIGPRLHTVGARENLWSIARDIYGDPRLYLFLADFAGVEDPNRLRLGQVLRLPEWHVLCERLKNNPSSVREGESLWQKMRAGQIPQNLTRVRVRSGNQNLIYPHEILRITPSQTPVRN